MYSKDQKARGQSVYALQQYYTDNLPMIALVWAKVLCPYRADKVTGGVNQEGYGNMNIETWLHLKAETQIFFIQIDKTGSSLNYVGESRQRIWPLFLCVSVVGSEHSGSPQRRKDTENFRFKFTHSKQRGATKQSGLKE